MAKKIKEPNFFIVGAAKSGTSSLANYIRQHPDVFMPSVKEPFFFVPDIGFDDYDEYISLFRKAGNAKAIGEASTGYLFHRHAASAIYERFPHAKNIIILRNPVEMAFSYWRYTSTHFDESLSFEDAICASEREIRMSDRFRKSCTDWWGNYVYIERGMYSHQVKRYMDVFGRTNVKVYIFERFIKSPKMMCRDVFDFLGVKSDFVPVFRVVNEGGESRFQLLRKLRNRRYPLLHAIFTSKFRMKVGGFTRELNTKRGERVMLNPTTKGLLDGIFRDDVEKLESILGYRIEEWRSRGPL